MKSNEKENILSIPMDEERKRTILKRIDNIQGFYAKLEYLNGLFLKAKTRKQEKIIEDLIKQLKFWGK